ncbi:HIRAN domain-containing protein [Dehalobacterium formicoaceticum]|uniref:HIRAN domain-containing protein n=1 Tax=Dehalobacterium formicoaceticum TaxID=51515 RepID=A0ABT1Y473_9FIRM|nr:HIRAN domain-containing protein [Dehalobacterium formicoaceticum]MCR6545669.1 HIRAN domain-containing protein [Dehalobacterium formicoaceticum]
MFENELYITITGFNHYYNMKPFKIGSFVILRKEPDNSHDNEAIEVLAPLLGRVGYVANSLHTTAGGTMSAGRLYDKIPNECVAVVRFMTKSHVIARVLPDKKLTVKIDITLENLTDENYSSVNINYDVQQFLEID